MYERKVKVKELQPSLELRSKTGPKDSEINTAAAQPVAPNKPEIQASFIEIISKRIDKLLEKAQQKSSAA